MSKTAKSDVKTMDLHMESCRNFQRHVMNCPIVGLGTKKFVIDASVPVTPEKRQKTYGGMNDFIDRPMSLAETGKCFLFVCYC